MTNDQKEALKKVFSAYEGYAVMGCEGNPLSYMRDVVDSIPGLVRVFPAISLKNDSVGVFKNIYFKKGVKVDGS